MLNLTQNTRPYKIEVYGLQDDYIGTLQSYSPEKGQIISPQLSISSDGTQEFTCEIPRYYVDVNDERKENPKWANNDKLLAENTRVLKVFVTTEDGVDIYPLLVTKFTDKRDGNFKASRTLHASSLAFAELGKIGYKLEFGWDVIEAYLRKHPEEHIQTNIQYWLDQVFPNQKNENGDIVKWLTPWSYEVRMDWRGYPDKKDRRSDTIYEDEYVADWIEDKKGNLVPAKINAAREMERVVEARGSNKYNICCSIAEVFKVFCRFEYKCDNTGRFINTYREDGKNWTGRKVIFYNKAIDYDNPFQLSYQDNLNTIERVADSENVYTKLYVSPVQTDTMTNGYITIADAAANPTMDEFLLNFDYMKEIGSITDLQYKEVSKYEAALRKINQEIQKNQVNYSNAQILVNQAESELRETELKLQSCEETLEEYEKLYNNEVINEPVERGSGNGCYVTAVPRDNYILAKIGLDGVEALTVGACIDKYYKEVLFTTKTAKLISNVSQIDDEEECFYVVVDVYGFATHVAASKTYIKSLRDISQGFKAVASYDNETFNRVVSLYKQGNYTEAIKVAGYNALDEDGNSYPESKQISSFITRMRKLINYRDANEGSGSNTYLDYLGFSKSLNLSGALDGNGGRLWLSLRYLPKNKYEKIYSQAVSLQGALASDITEKQQNAAAKKELLDALQDEYDALKEKKLQLDSDFEYLMGPALREGYWTPQDYTNINQTFTDVPAKITWDTEAFDGEQLPYELITSELGEVTKRGYYYLDVTDIFKQDSFANQNAGQFCLHFRRDGYRGELNSEREKIPAGWYSVTIDGVKKYFEVPTDRYPNEKGKLDLVINKQFTQITIGNALPYKFQISYAKNLPSTPPDITSMFEYLGNEIADGKAYEGAGIKLAFVRTKADIRIVAILLSQDLIVGLSGDVERQPYGYSILDKTDIKPFATSKVFTQFLEEDDFYPQIVYPRIIMEEENVQYNASSLVIKPVGVEDVILKNYYSYNVWLRALKDQAGNPTTSTRPHITLKICSSAVTEGDDVYYYYNYPTWILNGNYTISYEVSRANDDLYIDATQVALENSYPNYSYSLTVANIPENIKRISVGQMVYINDFILGMQRVSGYVDKIEYKLDQPWEDSIEIKNYNTKFEDLFTTISASSEAMKKNEHSYNIAASKFAAKGALAEDVQESLNDVSLGLTTGGGANLQLNDEDGLLLVDKQKNENNVYGMIALRSGGIFTSDSVDRRGDRIWKSVITSEGINASYIKAGQIDTNLIRIMSGGNPAFQWNSEGLFAYDSMNSDRYISYNSEGLKLNDGGVDKVEVSWDGFIIRDQYQKLFWVDDHGNLNIKGRIVSGGSIGDTPVDEINKDINTYTVELLSEKNFVCNLSNINGDTTIDTITVVVYKGNVPQPSENFLYSWDGEKTWVDSNVHNVEVSSAGEVATLAIHCDVKLKE